MCLSGKSRHSHCFALPGLPWLVGGRNTCCSLSSLDLTLPVLTPGLQSKSHKPNPASQTASFLFRPSELLPEAAPFPCYALITLCTPHSTVPHLWVPPLNPGSLSSTHQIQVSQVFEATLNKVITQARTQYHTLPAAPLILSVVLQDEQSSQAITQGSPTPPEKGPYPLLYLGCCCKSLD